MTDTSLADAFAQVFGPVTFRLPASPGSDYDEDTLRRSFGLSRSARREQRRPVATVTDELGFDRRGTWYASRDGAW